MGANFVFMDDNVHPYRVKIVRECLQSKDIIRMDRPAFLPDSNPVERLWDRLDRLFTEPVHYLLHIYWNFRKHCLMSGVVFPQN
ncbi:DDE_3 domain-containing protein [Trichonephila clavipes]|nr:DDE_3 domain-containing protein [Trichonephila clavipes]